jgi:3-hydroxy-9,10-secoandrosta-1,3,5(10)-triene-9,17-dione monooxygenase
MIEPERRSDFSSATSHAPDELVRRAMSLVQTLRANAPKAEELHRLPDDTIQALEALGLFRMLLPSARGGYGTDPGTISKVMTLIASGCASTAWVMSIYSAVAQLAELLGAEALAEIYADGAVRIAGVFGTAGAVLERAMGEYRVRGAGRWPFNSGCHHAAWDLLLMRVEEPDGTRWPAFAAIPMSDLTICDDWDVMGAIGTGSSSVACGPLSIPAHRVARVPQDLRAVISPELSAAQSCALPLGMARHALEEFLKLARSSGINHLGYARMADAPSVQSAVAKASVDIKLIEAFQQHVLSARSSGGAIDPSEAAILSLGPVRCLELARGVIERLFALAPSSEIHRTKSLQRLLRDVHVFEHQHAASPFINYELYGRRLFSS